MFDTLLRETKRSQKLLTDKICTYGYESRESVEQAFSEIPEYFTAVCSPSFPFGSADGTFNAASACFLMFRGPTNDYRRWHMTDSTRAHDRQTNIASQGKATATFEKCSLV